MKIALISDLHGASCAPINETVNFILAAGDITTNEYGIDDLTYITSDWSTPVFIVAGNHEFYGHDYDLMLPVLKSAHYLENDVRYSSGARILACTLWTDFDLYGSPITAMKAGFSSLNDFRMIRGWSPERQLQVHRQSRKWLETKLKEPFDGKTVVMTHHCPSQRSVNPKYGQDPLNACFASNLDYLFPYADLWVHGHTHTPFDYTVGRCRVVCNPRGYRGENPGPYKAKILSL